MHRPNRRSDRGFTLIEGIIVMGLTTMMFGVFSMAVNDAADFSATNLGSANLQDQGRIVLEQVRRDVAMGGRITDPVYAIPMPSTFVNGTPVSALQSTLRHDTTVLTARASHFPPAVSWTTPANPPPYVAPGNENEPMAFREIVIRQPADRDGDGRILAAATDTIEWSEELIAYIQVPNSDGMSCNLVRRRVTATGQVVDSVICRFVEAMTFDTTATKPTLPLDAVEIHLHLVRRNGRGQVQRLHLATTVAMRNSQ